MDSSSPIVFGGFKPSPANWSSLVSMNEVNTPLTSP
jgi:hypothetical protein